MVKIKDLLFTYQNNHEFGAELILSYCIKKPKEFLFTQPEYTLTVLEYARFLWASRKRAYGYPVAYITHHKEFFGLDFYINQHTLIPRPETELMVEEAIKEMEQQKDKEIILIDVGTGSGCIPIAITKTLKEKRLQAYAVDISHAALRVAKKNARIQKVFINFFHGNLLEPVFQNLKSEILNHKLIITANLPYLSEAQFAQEPSIQKEPKSALVARNNGLALYEELFAQLNGLFSASSYTLFLEIDPSQTSAITSAVRSVLFKAHMEIKKDLSGQDRLVIVKKN